jgi:glycosyltransferase involved in cell wall biosynthesis
MIQGRVIVCLASSWDYDPTSKHQIMRILSRYNDIVWVNYHGTRKPGPTVADVSAGLGALRRVARGRVRVSPSMIQVTPLVIPGARTRAARWLHQRMLTAQIRRALRSLPNASEKPLQTWTFAPDVPYLIGQFGEECFVYYCVDDYTQFEDFDTQAIIQSENSLLRRADLVVTTSQSLWETKRAVRDDAVLVRHGVDYDHFAAAWREPPAKPRDVEALAEPMFGFFGLIHHWIDCELIAQVAGLRPGYSFVLIGDRRVDVSRLESLPNVHLLGHRPYRELPAYCRAFTAGLLPFARNAMTRNINPIKMYEYLAAGLPVVSTPLPEARRHEGPIRIAESPEAFAAACDAVVAGDPRGRAAEISETVRARSWSSTVEDLSGIVMKHLREPARSPFPSAIREPLASVRADVRSSESCDSLESASVRS